MYWMLAAFSGPVLWAASMHIDKYLVERYFKEGSVAVLMVFTAIIGLVALPFIWYFVPGVLSLTWSTVAVLLVSGVLYMAGLYFYIWSLQTEEVSTVAPLFAGGVGVFGVLLGYAFLGEILSFLQLVGVACIVAGSVLLSIHFGPRKTKLRQRLVALILACALAIALSSLIFKFFAVRDEFWTTTFWTFVGESLFGAALMCLAANRRQFFAMVRRNTGPVISINAVNELVNLGGSLGARYALLFAPLGIVQSIGSTTSFFVLFFGILLSLFLPKIGREELSKTTLLQKSVSTGLVVVGIILINQ